MSSNIAIQRLCQHCGNEFTAKTTKTRFCSHICNSRAYKAQLKNGKIEVSNNETKATKNRSAGELKAKEFLSVQDTCTLLGGKSPFYDGKDLSVPFLNGGLFEDDFPNGKLIDFPIDYFTDLFDFFDQYNFTIDENSPEDHEVGIDPEMLGHIFENLLDDNRDKGTYYTPKEVVHYMSQQSIIQYLKNSLNSTNDEIDLFIKHNKPSPLVNDNALKIDNLLKNVKVCDPAIGSGAFPMGVLKVIFNARHSLHDLLNNSTEFDAAQIKKDIIHHSIYGVDMENGAVEIARLRFWLALVVDEIEPHPLPNLDYKIMQGNSVLESFEGIDLGVIIDETSNTAKKKVIKVDLFGNASKEDLQKTHSYSDIADELKELVSVFFNIDNTSRKQEIRNRINKLVHLHILLGIYMSTTRDYFKNQLIQRLTFHC